MLTALVRIKVFKQYSYLLYNLVKKDFTKKYMNSILGVIWSILNPLLTMVVVTIAFSQIFRIQVENFPIYYLTGTLVFNFMTGATSNSLTSIVNSSALIKKVYIPKYIFPLEKCIFELINTMFSFIAVLIMMSIIGLAPRLSILLFWVPILYVLIFSIGLSLILSAVNVIFRDVEHLYSVLIQAWLYLTPILYPGDALPESAKWFLHINPMYYYVDYFRQVVMYGNVPDLKSNLICILFSFVFLIVGIVVFKNNQDRFIFYI